MKKEDIIRSEILTNASKLFQKWGYSKTTIEDIARASGKTKTFLYYYYKDKEEIFVGVISREANNIFSFVSEQMEKHSTAEDKLKTYIETYLQEFNKYGNIYNIIVGELGKDIDLFKRIAVKFDAHQVDIITKILKYGVKNGEFDFPKDIEIKSIAYIIVNTIGSMQMDTIFFQKGNNSNIIKTMGWFFLEGIKKRIKE